MADLEIRNLHVRIEEREILRGVDLSVDRGEVHALMGPNGSGKSTLANTLLGHPAYEVTEGSILFKGEDITEAEPHERAKAGLFLAFQYPVAIPGVSVANFLRMAINAKREEPIGVKEFRDQLRHAIELLDVDRSFTSRHLNDGFSGGEKKRAEILQMAMLKPDIAILDETDSGLDIDALRTVAEGVDKLHSEQGLGALIITHYQRILHYIKPQFVHIMLDGRIVLEGGVELVERLEREGYDQIRQEFGAEPAAAGAAGGAATVPSTARPQAQRAAAVARQAGAPPRGDALPRAARGRRWRRPLAAGAARGGAGGVRDRGAAGVAALGLLDDELRGARPRRAGGASPHARRAGDAGRWCATPSPSAPARAAGAARRHGGARRARPRTGARAA